jgi:hypothetical protein
MTPRDKPDRSDSTPDKASSKKPSVEFETDDADLDKAAGGSGPNRRGGCGVAEPLSAPVEIEPGR